MQTEFKYKDGDQEKVLSLTDRDVWMLLFLWQNQFTSQRQLFSYFAGDADPALLARRLKKMELCHLIRSDKHEAVAEVRLENRKIYHILKVGNRVLIERQLLDPSLLTDYPTSHRPEIPADGNAMKHDLQVVQLRIVLSRTLMVTTWKSDHKLRLERRAAKARKDLMGAEARVSDGVFTFSTAAGPVECVLENEHAQYSRRTFQEIIIKLRSQYPSALVLFVTKHPENVPYAIGALKKIQNWELHSNHLLFGHYKDVSVKGARASWQCLNGPLHDGHVLLKGARFREDQTGS